MSGVYLTDEQKAFVNSRSPRLLCLAGGGCGKTLAVAERVVNLHSEGQKVLVLAFTNSAVSVITERLRERDVPVPVRTVVSFAWEVLRDNYEIDNFAISDCDDVLEMVVARTPVSKSQLRLFESAVANGAPISREWSHSLVELFDKFVKAKRERGLLSFVDVVMGAIDLPVEHFDEVIVDEAQDLTASQLAFINGLSFDRLTLVGDSEQSIFGFAGVDGQLLNKLSPDFDVSYLTRSFRVPAKLMPVLNSARVKPLVSEKPGGDFRLISAAPSEVENLVKATVGDDWLVIVRSNREVERFTEILPESVDVLTAHKAKGGEWKNVCVVGVGANGFETLFEVNGDEARRLFYVAVSRALENLVLIQTGDSAPFGLGGVKGE